MFEFVSGGSCACCGLPLLFNPDGVNGLIHAMSDLETDAANAEVRAVEKSPWPPEIRQQVWTDRILLRYKMKKEMNSYRVFVQDVVGGRETLQTFLETLGALTLRRIFQMPRDEIGEILKNTYNIHSAFRIVGCAVTEQIANFGVTKYETDGRGEEEVEFEQHLAFDRRAGFVFPMTKKIVTTKDDTGDTIVSWELNTDIVGMFVNAMDGWLGGVKLLQRGPSTVRHTQASHDEDDAAEEEVDANEGPSFRSDRRIVRLMIARYWADQIVSKWNAVQKKKSQYVLPSVSNPKEENRQNDEVD